VTVAFPGMSAWWQYIDMNMIGLASDRLVRLTSLCAVVSDE